MCDYLSAIGLMDGDVYHQDGVDRHSELAGRLAPRLGISPQHLFENSFELEFKPVQGLHLGKIEAYCLNIDKFTGYGVPSPHRAGLEFAKRQEKIKDLRGVWQAKLLEVARNKILSTGHIKVLPPGDWVLCGDVIVDEVTERSRVIALLDDAQIRDYARNAEITVYGRNDSPEFKNIPSDYYSYCAHQKIAKDTDALRAIKDPKFFCENVFGVDLAKGADWMKVRLFGEEPNADPAAVHEAEMFRKNITGKKSDLVIFDDVEPRKKI